MALAEMMHESIWFDKPKFEEEEAHYQLHLAGNKAGFAKKTGTHSAASALIDEIAKARNSIKKSLNEAPGSHHKSKRTVEMLEKENSEMRQIIADLTKRMGDLEVRMTKLEGNKPTESEKVSEKPKPDSASAKPKDDDDDDFDLFESDEEEENKEDDEERKKLLEKYHEKKSKKPAVIAKSNILLDVKPWADDTDLEEMERLVRGIATDGLVWGASKLVPVAFGIKKLQIACVVEDDKVGTDFLEETIQEFDDHVQSVDVAAFNKV